MKLQLIQWNIKINSNPTKIANYINNKISKYSIINLQEVSQSSYEIIKGILGLESTFSLKFRLPGLYEGKNRRMGVMTIVHNCKLCESKLIENSVFPERTLFSRILIENISINNINFHSLTGVDYKKAKSSNFASIASFIHNNKIDIMSCDANEPEFDSYIDDEIQFFDNKDKGEMASLLFGKNRVHNLVDSYKFYSFQNKLNLQDGYSHITGGKKRRYDFIYTNRDWNILNSSVDYINSLGASSDHGIIETIVEI